MAEAVLGTHDDWQIGKTKIFLKVSPASDSGCEFPIMGGNVPSVVALENLQHQMGSVLGLCILLSCSL